MLNYLFVNMNLATFLESIRISSRPVRLLLVSLFNIFFVVATGVAQVNLDLNFDSTSEIYTLEVSSSLEDCACTLRGRSKSLGKLNSYKKLLSFDLDLNKNYQLRELPSAKKGKSAINSYQFRASCSCNGGKYISNKAKLKVKRSKDGLGNKLWEYALKKRLALQFSVEQRFPTLTFSRPTDLQSSSALPNRIFVVEQKGTIYSFLSTNESAGKILFLDISDRVTLGSESGLLGLAFDPDFEHSRYFYLNYVNLEGSSVISRFQVDPSDFALALPSSEEQLLVIPKSETFHHGGQLAFGPDGYLYVAIGDGGPQGDPENHAQDLSALLGKLLRIDVSAPSESLPYTIPSDNPFVGNDSGAREEIFAYGFRNPWRFSFDASTGDLLLGDVGYNELEEIDLVKKGGNYGWRLFEGNTCRSAKSICKKTKVVKPIHEYSHDYGFAITGGYVYRGNSIASLSGVYLFGDYLSGRIWGLDRTKSKPLAIPLSVSNNYISTFGRDTSGELFFLDFGTGGIFQLVESTE